MKNSALIVVDIQNLLIEEQPYQVEKMLATINKAIQIFREKNRPILFIQHTNEELEANSKGWQVSERIDIRDSDPRFVKSYSSMFKDTQAEDFLKENGIDTLLFCGMQTDYCLDTSIKVAFEKGYRIRILKDGFTTFDADEISAHAINTHYENVWSSSFGEMVGAEALE